MKVRRSYAHIKYNGKNVALDFTPFLESFSYTDNMNKADNLEVTLSGDRWIKNWQILKGDIVEGAINVYDWKHKGDNRVLNIGSFSVDHISFSGSPDRATLSATSASITSPFREVAKDKTWEKITLKEIAGEIATQNGLSLYYDVPKNFNLDKVEQAKETDSKLLSRLCLAQGTSLKVFKNKIIIFSEKKYEDHPPKLIFRKEDLTNYSLDCADHQIYDKCIISYQDHKLGETLEGSFEAPRSKFYKVRTGKELVVDTNQEVVGETKELKIEELNKRAKIMLRNHNKNETQIRLNGLMGNPNITSGMTCNVRGFGIYDGVYLIIECKHTIDSKYTTDVTLRRRLGY